jgi:protease PrsW
MNPYVLIALAVAPGLAIAFFIYERDKLDREPLRLLIICFVLGALSVVPAALLENGSEYIGFINDGTILNSLFYALMVGFVEEVCKYVILVRFAYPKKDFNEPFDGITYGVMVGMGFATLENVFYVTESGLMVGVLRMFTAVPAHASFAVLMGYFVGLAKFNPARSRQLKLMGLLVATVFHTLYDYFQFIGQESMIFFAAFISLIIAVRLSIRAIRLHRQNSPFANPVQQEEPPRL